MRALLAGCSVTAADAAPASDPLLPASFAGTLPCSDCEGVRAQLDLWPDGIYHLQRIHLGRAAGRDDDRGRWQPAPGRDEIRLHGEFRYLADAASFEECLTGRRPGSARRT
jgi:copper homeostasis protein (lipoprotein)